MCLGLILSALSCGRADTAASPAMPASQNQPVIYVIPIRGMIEPALVYVVRRGVAEAERGKAAAVIFVMDTPGGRLDAAQNIVQILQFIRLPTYTLVEKNALSAGAYIAMATRHIYMTPGSTIGAAAPMMMTPWGGVQEIPDSVKEKINSAFASMFRAAAQQGGHDDEVAEAMVRPEKELRIGDQVVSKAGELLTLTNEEAARIYPGRDRPLLSSGTVRDLNELLRVIGFENANVRQLEVTSAERLARFVAALAPLLLIAGALGLYIEFRTPGFGLPGILGLLCLAAFFWGHHIAGLAGWEELLLFVVGFALLLIEIFFIPGFGMVGFIGLLLMAAGILLSMAHRPPAGPWWPSFASLAPAIRSFSLSIIGIAVGGVLLGRWLPRTPLARRLWLTAATSRAGGYASAPDRPELVGRSGVALTVLRPSGIASVDGQRMDVIAEGEFIECGRKIRIVRVEGSRVFVVSESAPPQESA